MRKPQSFEPTVIKGSPAPDGDDTVPKPSTAFTGGRGASRNRSGGHTGLFLLLTLERAVLAAP